ncbi:hypothetical protein BN381_170025 [Candidatus Microthrix parvicella RN1]|uniref:Uncharacterized protein n=1 Tax=Candidatus Neomicrothrix parvicella RN1 TaxID=1229780 RepID=R4YXG1_9ACTN|nr:hypothetical protein BN381_170025 [Candidatus Microthrix parvicella RN1]
MVVGHQAGAGDLRSNSTSVLATFYSVSSIDVYPAADAGARVGGGTRTVTPQTAAEGFS